MGKPAARIGDMHMCPMVTGTVPHIGGPIIGPGCPTVLIGGQPAAVMSDMCVCTGPPDTIVLGSSGVLIGGKPAARLGDQCAHGGAIVAGCPTVLIGETASVAAPASAADKSTDAIQKVMQKVQELEGKIDLKGLEADFVKDLMDMLPPGLNDIITQAQKLKDFAQIKNIAPGVLQEVISYLPDSLQKAISQFVSLRDAAMDGLKFCGNELSTITGDIATFEKDAAFLSKVPFVGKDIKKLATFGAKITGALSPLQKKITDVESYIDGDKLYKPLQKKIDTAEARVEKDVSKVTSKITNNPFVKSVENTVNTVEKTEDTIKNVTTSVEKTEETISKTMDNIGKYI